jgi:transposase, IS5 family
VRFRERINVELVQKINQRMVEKSQSERSEESKKRAGFGQKRNLRKVK